MPCPSDPLKRFDQRAFREPRRAREATSGLVTGKALPTSLRCEHRAPGVHRVARKVLMYTRTY